MSELKTKRGTPYSLAEAEMVVAKHAMDEYHRSLMAWLISQVKPIPATDTESEDVFLGHLYTLTHQGKGK